MIGHVGDFGLARFLHEEPTDSSTNQSSSIGLRGTIGYAPPEYGMGNEVSTYEKNSSELEDVGKDFNLQVQRASDSIGWCMPIS
ncbi:hypothetical protein CMV_024536 [Castanea mollissima]|uniref:Protein kinase domain-containing protein n=1 Tax=Castanea mollissima TaxID=60419 RepID=A0A8J4V5S1_9ROSI|nr:hypothetical protein CMV_024536 [Castanea mollissima]